MSGVIGVAANDVARYTFFAMSIDRILRPPNTDLRWALGSDRIRGRNNLVRDTLDQGGEWLLFIDDDHAFQPDLLLRLLAHEEPIVASLYLARSFPFHPIVYSDRLDDDLTYVPINLADYPPSTSLIQVRAAGTGGMLIRSEVFRALEEPWFKDGAASEDLTFCERAYDAGFLIHCDLQARLGHCSVMVIRPDEEEGKWVNTLDVPNGRVKLPLAGAVERAHEPQEALT